MPLPRLIYQFKQTSVFILHIFFTRIMICLSVRKKDICGDLVNVKSIEKLVGHDLINSPAVSVFVNVKIGTTKIGEFSTSSHSSKNTSHSVFPPLKCSNSATKSTNSELKALPAENPTLKNLRKASNSRPLAN